MTDQERQTAERDARRRNDESLIAGAVQYVLMASLGEDFADGPDDPDLTKTRQRRDVLVRELDRRGLGIAAIKAGHHYLQSAWEAARS